MIAIISTRREVNQETLLAIWRNAEPFKILALKYIALAIATDCR